MVHRGEERRNGTTCKNNKYMKDVGGPGVRGGRRLEVREVLNEQFKAGHGRR
jgi:hypothetical protein